MMFSFRDEKLKPRLIFSFRKKKFMSNMIFLFRVEKISTEIESKIESILGTHNWIRSNRP